MVDESPRAMASPSQRHFGVLRSPPVGSSPRVPSVVGVTAAPSLLAGTTSLHGPVSQPGPSVLSVSHCTSVTPLSACRTQPDVFGGRDASPGRSGADGCRHPLAGCSPRLQLLQRRAHTSAQMLRHAAGNLLSAVEVTAVEARAIAASSLALHIITIDAVAQVVVAVLLEPPPVADTAAAASVHAMPGAAVASQVGSEVPGLAAGDRVAVVCPSLLAALRAEVSPVNPEASWRIRMPPPAGVVLPSALPGGTGRRLRVAGVVLGLDFVPLDQADPLLSQDAMALSGRLTRGDVDALFPCRSGAGGRDEQSWSSAVVRRFSWAENLYAPRLVLVVTVVRLLASRRALVEDDAGQLGVVIVRSARSRWWLRLCDLWVERCMALWRCLLSLSDERVQLPSCRSHAMLTWALCCCLIAAHGVWSAAVSYVWLIAGSWEPVHQRRPRLKHCVSV